MSTTTIAALNTSALGDLGTGLLTAVTTVVGFMVALIILGFLWRKVKSKVTGKKF